MKFSKFTEYLEKLELESKRNKLIQIVSKLFKSIQNSAEMEKIIYLLQGRVAPFFAPIEIGMAEQTVAESVGRAYGVSKEEVIKDYRKKGDLGLVAEELNQKQETSEAGLKVSEVYDQLLSIANTGGEGSVEKKIISLTDLLQKINPISAKHLVRIPLGISRLGIGDPTVLDALSFSSVGDKSLRKDLEAAYNKTSDLGFVAKTFWEQGIEGIKKVKLQVLKPVRPALAERLPSEEQIVKKMAGQFAAEPKMDGFRVQVHKDGAHVQMYSRNLENMTHMFPDLVEGVKNEVRAKQVIFEGEAIAYNPETKEFYPFQETTKRRRKHGVAEAALRLPLKLFTFDLLFIDGEDITPQSYEQRRRILEKVVPEKGERIMVSEERVMDNAKDLKAFFEEAISEGLEGLMIKKLNAPYQAGARGFHWVKYKRATEGELNDTIDCVVLGFFYGRGKRTGFGVGGLLLGVYDSDKDEFVTISRLGTGLTDLEWQEIRKQCDKLTVDKKPARVSSVVEPSVWVEPRIVVEILADEITRSPIHTAGKVNDEPGYALRFPRLISFREEDKRAEDATSVKEVIEMYQNQFK